MTTESWTPDIFEALFRADADPWQFESSAYERDKLARLLDCLPQERFRFALELGCAVGVGTRIFATRCSRVLAVDASATALTLARKRCEGVGDIRFVEAFLPGAYPSALATGCDLVILSEILYFLNRNDIRRLAASVIGSLAPDGTLLLVNWTGETDTPCTGDEAADCFIEACRDGHWLPDHREQTESYRIDRLRHTTLEARSRA